MQKPLQDKEALIATFWQSFEEHERSRRSDTFQPLFNKVLERRENGNEEVAYLMLWSGKRPCAEEARIARSAKERYAIAASPMACPIKNRGRLVVLRQSNFGWQTCHEICRTGECGFNQVLAIKVGPNRPD